MSPRRANVLLVMVLVACAEPRESSPLGHPESVTVPPPAPNASTRASNVRATPSATSRDAGAAEDPEAAFTDFTQELGIAAAAARSAASATTLADARRDLQRVVDCLAAADAGSGGPCPHMDAIMTSLSAALEDAGAAISPKADRQVALDAARAGIAAADVPTARKHAAVARARLERLHALAEADEFGMFGLLRGARGDGGMP